MKNETQNQAEEKSVMQRIFESDLPTQVKKAIAVAWAYGDLDDETDVDQALDSDSLSDEWKTQIDSARNCANLLEEAVCGPHFGSPPCTSNSPELASRKDFEDRLQWLQGFIDGMEPVAAGHLERQAMEEVRDQVECVGMLYHCRCKELSGSYRC